MSDHTPTYTLTPYQRQNLKKLASYLEQLKPPESEEDPAFDMADFTTEDVGHDECRLQLDCGSCGCAIGHGPYAGIPKLTTETWYQYHLRVFGTEVYGWCFAGEWKEVDNTPQGAAARIRIALEHGIPNDYRQQLNGDEPLQYQLPVDKPNSLRDATHEPNDL